MLTLIQKGMEGRSIRGTFYLYLASLALLGPVAIFIAFAYSYDDLLMITPVLVGSLVITEFGIYYYVKKGRVKNKKSALKTETLFPKQFNAFLSKRLRADLLEESYRIASELHKKEVKRLFTLSVSFCLILAVAFVSLTVFDGKILPGGPWIISSGLQGFDSILLGMGSIFGGYVVFETIRERFFHDIGNDEEPQNRIIFPVEETTDFDEED